MRVFRSGQRGVTRRHERWIGMRWARRASEGWSVHRLQDMLCPSASALWKLDLPVLGRACGVVRAARHSYRRKLDADLLFLAVRTMERNDFDKPIEHRRSVATECRSVRSHCLDDIAPTDCRRAARVDSF